MLCLGVHRLWPVQYGQLSWTQLATLNGSQSVLDVCEKSRPPPVFDPRTVQAVASRYTDWGIPASRELHKSKLQYTSVQLYSAPRYLSGGLTAQRPPINTESAQVHKHTKRNKAQKIKEQKTPHIQDEVTEELTSRATPHSIHSGFARANSSTVDRFLKKNSTSTLIHETQQQYRQCTYNVTLWRVRATIVAVEKTIVQ
jgi:hypothetical protein